MGTDNYWEGTFYTVGVARGIAHPCRNPVHSGREHQLGAFRQDLQFLTVVRDKEPRVTTDAPNVRDPEVVSVLCGLSDVVSEVD